jgi:GPH family glycoside/pentoside/hexuronide:cation symporter
MIPVSKKTKFFWGISGIADTFMTYGLATLVMPIFNLGYGVDAVLLGYMLFIPRFIDAIVDPIIGSISDNTRSRWGRRRPYIFLGALIAGILFPVIWLPPFEGQTAILLWFVFFMVLKSLSYSIFSIPCAAMGYEFTTDYDEKTRVMRWRLVLSVIAGISVQWLYKILVHPYFGGSEVDGIRYIGPVIGLIVFITGVSPALFCREVVNIKSQEKIKLKEAFSLTLKNRSFAILMIGYIIIIFGMNTVGNLGLYVNIFYVCGGDKELAGTIGGISGSIMIAGAFVSMFLIGKLSELTSKRIGVLTGLGFGLIGNLSLWFFMSPDNPYLQLISAGFIGLGIQGCWLMIDSMIGDVCDDDEVKTGMRREGMYSAVKSFSMQVAVAMAAVSAGYMLSLSGFDEKIQPNNEVCLNMKLLLIIVQCFGLGIGIFLFSMYPLSKEKCLENQRLLENKKTHAKQHEGIL